MALRLCKRPLILKLVRGSQEIMMREGCYENSVVSMIEERSFHGFLLLACCHFAATYYSGR